jgi:transposase-like protein
MIEETKVTCPRCGSSLIVKLGNQLHCNACSEEFQIDKHPIASAAAERKAQRTAATGYYTTKPSR